MTFRISTLLALVSLLISSCGTNKITTKNISPMITPFEQNENYSVTYQEAITYYNNLAMSHEMVKVFPVGITDSGHPLHEVIIDKDKVFDPKMSRKSGKTILLINNAIHPGEPCGVDASMMLSRDLVMNPEKSSLLDNTVIVIVPLYNISGALNRGSYSRANQEGPESYGFRGNAQHLDLNRDFIKCDTKNAESFNKLFNKWDPDVFIDNHTSNGADYQYVITLIATQKDKLESNLSKYMEKEMLPDLYKGMKKSGYEMTPYVYSRTTPDEGIAGFLDLARYSSGYAALHNTISFMPETHMLKPYKDRVWSVYYFMENMLEHLSQNHLKLLKERNRTKDNIRKMQEMELNWALDFNKAGEVNFKGYEAKYKPSEVTGQSRLYYDHGSPFEKKVPFFNTYSPSLTIKKPNAYLIPQAYRKVIERLKWNNVQMEKISSDTTMDVSVYRIENYESPKRPYEGHFLHSKIEVSTEKKKVLVRKGDVMVYTGQDKDRYIVETLEPQAPDSFFAWNFMDGIMMQKEHFSSYVFEDLAEELLKKDKKLKKAFEKKKEEDIEFSQNARAQLNYIYKRSPHYEEGYMRYPVLRAEKN